MPSKTAKQARTMAAAAHNPAFAKKVGIPVDVAKEFNKADKGKKFGGGGMAKHSEKSEMKSDIKQDKAMIKKAVGMHDKQMHGGKKTNLEGLKKGGVTRADGAVIKGHTRGTMAKMCGGGMAKGKK